MTGCRGARTHVGGGARGTDGRWVALEPTWKLRAHEDPCFIWVHAAHEFTGNRGPVTPEHVSLRVHLSPWNLQCV